MTVEGPLTASRLDNYIAALSIVSERLDVVVADETIHAFLVMALDGEMQSAQHIVVEPG